MARPRKNAPKPNTQELSLVPVEEQPYPLPEGWKWVRLGSVCAFIGGGTPDKSQKEYWNGDIPWASVKDVKGSYLYSTIDNISELGLKNSAANICCAGELILVTRISPAKTVIAMIETAINQDLKIVKSNLPVKFLHHYFCNFENLFVQKASGTTVKGITIPNLQTTPIPLPPLDEQERIVTRIESLFAKLDEAKEKAEAVLDSYETRKAAILHKAFTGELTAKWREERGIEKDSWNSLTLKDIAKWGSGGTPSRKHPEYYTGDIAWVKTGELNNDYLYDTEEHITPDAVKNSSAKLFPKETVIIAMYGATIGQCAILGIEATTNQACACAVVNSSIDNRFLFAYLLSQKSNFINLGKGGAQPNISQAVLKDYPINLPCLPEQQEITRILNSLLEKEQQSKEAAETVLEQIDLMKKAILAKAFRGELG